jgi:low affinity Fe/Cu permease
MRSASSHFSNLARQAASLAGSPLVFLCAVLVVVGWAVTGPLFGFSDTWQLVINTGTTIVTFLMVFLIQNSQNRDTIAIHVKLDELVRAVKEARNSVIDLENMDEEDLTKLLAQYRKLARAAARDATDLDEIQQE